MWQRAFHDYRHGSERVDEGGEWGVRVSVVLWVNWCQNSGFFQIFNPEAQTWDSNQQQC